MNPHEVKNLQVQITKAKADEKAAHDEVKQLEQVFQKRKAIRTSPEAKLSLAMVEPSVSEHALLRYIERVYGIDLKQVENQILTEPNKRAIKTIINGKLPLGCGFKAIIKNMNVVSITD